MSTNWNYVYYIVDCTLQVGEFDIVKYWPHWSPTPQTFLRTGKGIGPPRSPPIRNVNKLKTTCTILWIVHYRLVNLISWNLLAPLVPNTPNISPHRKRIWSTPIAPDKKCQQTETTCTILWIVHYRWAILILRLPTEIGHNFDEITRNKKDRKKFIEKKYLKNCNIHIKNRHITEKK